MSNKFPITIIDNFYENPDKVVRYANTLNYKKSLHGSFPGGRTDALHNINKNLFNLLCAKLFGIFYNLKVEDKMYWDVVSNFYKIDKPTNEDNHTTGWIHRDDQFMLAGIIYLNKDWQNSIGTKFYHKINDYEDNTYSVKNDYFLGKTSLKDYLNVKEKHNLNYEETDSISPVYNRMVCYDSSYFHTNANLSNLKTDRLTQVFFVDKLNGGLNFKFPIERITYK